MPQESHEAHGLSEFLDAGDTDKPKCQRLFYKPLVKMGQRVGRHRCVVLDRTIIHITCVHGNIIRKSHDIGSSKTSQIAIYNTQSNIPWANVLVGPRCYPKSHYDASRTHYAFVLDKFMDVLYANKVTMPRTNMNNCFWWDNVLSRSVTIQ